MRGGKWEKLAKRKGGGCAQNARGKRAKSGGRGKQGKCAQNARELGDGEEGREES